MTVRSRRKLSSDVSVVAVYGWAGQPWGPILPYVLTDANIAAHLNEPMSPCRAGASYSSRRGLGRLRDAWPEKSMLFRPQAQPQRVMVTRCHHLSTPAKACFFAPMVPRCTVTGSQQRFRSWPTKPYGSPPTSRPRSPPR
jgi:hypothetical protein